MPQKNRPEKKQHKVTAHVRRLTGNRVTKVKRHARSQGKHFFLIGRLVNGEWAWSRVAGTKRNLPPDAKREWSLYDDPQVGHSEGWTFDGGAGRLITGVNGGILPGTTSLDEAACAAIEAGGVSNWWPED